MDRLFRVGIAIKALDGLLEVAAGLLLPWVSVGAIERFVTAITQEEISEDPTDLVANALRRSVEHFSRGSKAYAVVYLMVHGLIKIGLVVALWRNRRWAFPLALWVLGAFVAYQSYRCVRDYSFGLLAITVVDIVVIGLVWLEYRRRWGTHGKNAGPPGKA